MVVEGGGQGTPAPPGWAPNPPLNAQSHSRPGPVFVDLHRMARRRATEHHAWQSRRNGSGCRQHDGDDATGADDAVEVVWGEGGVVDHNEVYTAPGNRQG